MLIIFYFGFCIDLQDPPYVEFESVNSRFFPSKLSAKFWQDPLGKGQEQNGEMSSLLAEISTIPMLYLNPDRDILFLNSNLAYRFEKFASVILRFCLCARHEAAGLTECNFSCVRLAEDG
jgi:hypothetical protein